jgi:hypothetical protein
MPGPAEPTSAPRAADLRPSGQLDVDLAGVRTAMINSTGGARTATRSYRPFATYPHRHPTLPTRCPRRRRNNPVQRPMHGPIPWWRVRSAFLVLHFGGVTTLVVSLITALASAVLAGVGTYFTTRRDLQLKFDASLRDLRIDAYKELWKDLEDLAKYGRPDPLSKSEAQRLRDTLRTWYFHTGGLVLSTDTRQDYFTLLDGLELVINSTADEVRVEDDEFLRVLGSRLRTAMTRDVGTRRTFVFRGDAERDERWPETQTYVADGGRELVIVARRRLRIARRLRLRGRLVADESQPRPPSGAELVRWEPARKALTLRFARGRPDDGDSEERILLVEDGYVVEGPKGWHRGDTAPRSPSVIWRKHDQPTARSNSGHGT